MKLKFLLFILDYPGLSKVLTNMEVGHFVDAFGVFVRGKHSKALDKVIYLSNRSYLCKEDPLRPDKLSFVPKTVDNFEKPKLRMMNIHTEKHMKRLNTKLMLSK